MAGLRASGGSAHTRRQQQWLRSRGYTSLTPYFCCADTNRAIGFYTTVFGACVVTRSDGPDGAVAHCELELDNGRMRVSDRAPDHHLVAPAVGRRRREPLDGAPLPTWTRSTQRSTTRSATAGR